MSSYVSGYIFNANDIGELVIDAVEKLMEERDSQLGLEENQYAELQARYDDLYNDFQTVHEDLIKLELDILDKADYIEQLEQRIRELSQEVLKND